MRFWGQAANWPSSVLHKGGGDNGQSEHLQKLSMQQSQRQFDQQMKLQKAQLGVALPTPPVPVPIAPPPTKTSAETIQASDGAREEALKRRGLLASFSGAGNTGGYGAAGAPARNLLG